MSKHEDHKIIIEAVQQIATRKLIPIEVITHEDVDAIVNGLTGGLVEHHFLDQDDCDEIKKYLISRMVVEK